MNDSSGRPMVGAGGLAALSICESLLISLTEKGVLGEDEAHFVLEDAANAHRCAIEEKRSVALHAAAARLIELIMAQSNAIRGTSRVGTAEGDPANTMDRTDGST